MAYGQFLAKTPTVILGAFALSLPRHGAEKPAEGASTFDFSQIVIRKSSTRNSICNPQSKI